MKTSRGSRSTFVIGQLRTIDFGLYLFDLPISYVSSLTVFQQFSLMAQSLFDSYNSMVSTSNMDELYRTAMAWNNQQCSLVALRPGGCTVVK